MLTFKISSMTSKWHLSILYGWPQIFDWYEKYKLWVKISQGRDTKLFCLVIMQIICSSKSGLPPRRFYIQIIIPTVYYVYQYSMDFEYC